jgi:hypothetical protein
MKLYLPEHRSVAKRFGLSESAVYRHKNEHLPAHLLKAREAEDLRTALAAISQARGNLELLGKLAGISRTASRKLLR